MKEGKEIMEDILKNIGKLIEAKRCNSSSNICL